MWVRRLHSEVVTFVLMESSFSCLKLVAVVLLAMAWRVQCSHGRLLNEATMIQLSAATADPFLEAVDPQYVFCSPLPS